MTERNPKLVSFDEGEEIYSPFSSSPKVHFIESGYVAAATIDDDGKHRIHLIYGPGSYFPILSIFRGSQQRATYSALTDVRVSVMNVTGFLDKLETDGQFCRDVLGQTVDQLALFADRVIDLQTTKLSDQLLLKLRSLAKDHGIQMGGYSQLPYKLRHQQIANLLGAERESVSRNIKKLEKDGSVIILKTGFLKVLI